MSHARKQLLAFDGVADMFRGQYAFLVRVWFFQRQMVERASGESPRGGRRSQPAASIGSPDAWNFRNGPYGHSAPIEWFIVLSVVPTVRCEVHEGGIARSSKRQQMDYFIVFCVVLDTV